MKRIILDAQRHIGEDRSIFGLFHILQGRSSIQTIQDVKLYRLSPIYGIYRSLDRNRFVTWVQSLKAQHLLQEVKQDHFTLTQEGETWLSTAYPSLEHFYLNGERYGRQGKYFFNRLQLIIQVWTNTKKANNQFIPVIEEESTMIWVKQFYEKTKRKTDIYLMHLYEELHALFLMLPAQYPEIFLAQLSSYHHIGKTTDQLAIQYQMEKEDIHLITTNIVHYLLNEVGQHASTYPVLQVLMRQLDVEDDLTNSAKVTAQYLQQGNSLDKIAKIRRLKINTIYDHVVELAMHQHPMVNLDDYVTKKVFIDIEQAVLQSGSYKLKAIKENVNETISYFQIRLVLAFL